VRSRADRVAKVLALVDAFVDHVDANFDEKAREAKLSSLPDLVKLAELLVGEATDRMELHEVTEALTLVTSIAVTFIPKARRNEFLAAVRKALGAIGGDE